MDETNSGYLIRMLEERLPEYRTLRDEIAISAMQGLLADGGDWTNHKHLAECGYSIADAMLAARNMVKPEAEGGE